MIKQWPLLIIFLYYTGLNGAADQQQAEWNKNAAYHFVQAMHTKYLTSKLNDMQAGEFKSDLRLLWREMTEEEKLSYLLVAKTKLNEY